MELDAHLEKAQKILEWVRPVNKLAHSLYQNGFESRPIENLSMRFYRHARKAALKSSVVREKFLRDKSFLRDICIHEAGHACYLASKPHLGRVLGASVVPTHVNGRVSGIVKPYNRLLRSEFIEMIGINYAGYASEKAEDPEIFRDLVRLGVHDLESSGDYKNGARQAGLYLDRFGAETGEAKEDVIALAQKISQDFIDFHFGEVKKLADLLKERYILTGHEIEAAIG